MRRLIIHLKEVEKTKDNKIFNTLSIPFSTEKQLAHHLSMHEGNIKSHRVTSF